MAYQPVTRSELKTKTSPRPGVVAVHDVIVWSLAGRGLRSGGIYNRRPRRGLTVLLPSTASLHAVGRAADFMVPAGDEGKHLGDEVFLRLIRANVAVGVGEIIWNRARWTAEKGVQSYKGSNPHTDHVHVGHTVDWADRPNTEELRRWAAAFLFAP